MKEVKEKKEEVKQPLFPTIYPVETELKFRVDIPCFNCLTYDDVTDLIDTVNDNMEEIVKHLTRYFSSFGFSFNNTDEEITVDFVVNTSNSVIKNRKDLKK